MNKSATRTTEEATTTAIIVARPAPAIPPSTRLSARLPVFEQGTQGRQHSDKYLRATVTLATVLLLIAISQRSKTRRVRLGLLVFAMCLLCFPVFHILMRGGPGHIR
jgi:hypothetical protein